MSNDIEESGGKRSPQVFRSLAAQAGMSWTEFLSLIGGADDEREREAALRTVARRAEIRNAGCRRTTSRVGWCTT
jgi:hypothetical protein